MTDSNANGTASTIRSLERDVGTVPPSETETATFGMGCFWGPDALFGALDGVVRTRVGYAGGTTQNPRYYSLGDHTEVVRLEYDPTALSYDDLLETCFENHDWASTAPKRQYRSVVLAHDDEQYETAARRVDALEERTGRSAATDVERLDGFTRAEAYHQKYELRSTPVVGDKLEALYGDAFVDSTVVARLNGFAAGHGTPSQRDELLAALELPPTVRSELRRRF